MMRSGVPSALSSCSSSAPPLETYTEEESNTPKSFA